MAIQGGKVYDPGSGWDGVERDLFIANGRLVDRLDHSWIRLLMPGAWR